MMVPVLLLQNRCFASRGIPRSWPLSTAFFSCTRVDTEELMKRGSTWYCTGTCSSWADLPNGRKIRGWLHQFPGKLAGHPGVGVTQLMISKFPRNPPSSCAAQQPPACEQLEYCWPQNIGVPPIDPILFGQLRLSAVERAHNNGCWPLVTW